MSYPSPDKINADRGYAAYKCRVCRAETGLVWFNGTSCPVCRKPECAKELWREYDEAVRQLEEDENW